MTLMKINVASRFEKLAFLYMYFGLLICFIVRKCLAPDQCLSQEINLTIRIVFKPQTGACEVTLKYSQYLKKGDYIFGL